MRTTRKYTEEEDSLLKKISYPDDLNKMAMVLGRTISSVRRRADRLCIPTPINICMYSDDYSNEDKAYFAGHFDADGCIRMAKKYNNKTMPYFPQVEVTISSVPTIYKYKEYFNGRAYTKNKPRNKQLYTWMSQSLNDIYNFVISVLPYSIEKREQLVLIKEWIEKRITYNATTRLPSDFVHYTSFIASEVKRLKRESECYVLKGKDNDKKPYAKWGD